MPTHRLDGKAMVWYGYSDFGEVYVREKNFQGKFLAGTAKVPEELINREIVNRLYTGGTHDQLSGLIHLDARHYSPGKSKFIQPDPYNLTELSLPKAVRRVLVKQAELRLGHLLFDPMQRLDTSYVANNPLKWVDPLGLAWYGNFLGPVSEGDPSPYGNSGINPTDEAARLHDIAYNEAGAEGVSGALFNIDQRVIDADLKLARDAARAVFSKNNSLSGRMVGAVTAVTFGAIGVVKSIVKSISDFFSSSETACKT